MVYLTILQRLPQFGKKAKNGTIEKVKPVKCHRNPEINFMNSMTYCF